jgi:hypothetical protein
VKPNFVISKTLTDMKEEYENTNLIETQSGKKEESDTEGYPSFSDNEDAYILTHEEKDFNPEYLSETKESKYKDGIDYGQYFNKNIFVGTLDVPVSELNDEDENGGSGGKENDYYSLGGDNFIAMDE